MKQYERSFQEVLKRRKKRRYSGRIKSKSIYLPDRKISYKALNILMGV